MGFRASTLGGSLEFASPTHHCSLLLFIITFLSAPGKCHVKSVGLSMQKAHICIIGLLLTKGTVLGKS